MRHKIGFLFCAICLLSTPAVAEEAAYRHCARLCLELSMQILRHLDRTQVDLTHRVLGQCTGACPLEAQAAGLDAATQTTIQSEILATLPKPPSWGLRNDSGSN